MNISILCSSPAHPVIERLKGWKTEMISKGHSVSLVNDKAALECGDILFLVSCSQIIGEQERNKFKSVLVLHASDLPKGRGWSPHIWAILGGSSQITVSLLEADDPVDTGAIWFKTSFNLEGHELLPEINKKLFTAELTLMDMAVENFSSVSPIKQHGDTDDYQAKRTPADSRIDPEKTIAEQFDLFRVVDPERYPAFFDYRGKRYLIRVEKMQNE